MGKKIGKITIDKIFEIQERTVMNPHTKFKYKRKDIIMPLSFLVTMLIIFGFLFVISVDRNAERGAKLEIYEGILGKQEICMSTNEACKLFFDADYGYGTLNNLRCSKDGEYKVYSTKDIGVIEWRRNLN